MQRSSIQEAAAALRSNSFALFRLSPNDARVVQSAFQSAWHLCRSHRTAWLASGQPPPISMAPPMMKTSTAKSQLPRRQDLPEDPASVLLDSDLLRTQIRWQGSMVRHSAVPEVVLQRLSRAWMILEPLALSCIQECDPDVMPYVQPATTPSTLLQRAGRAGGAGPPSQNILDVFHYGERGGSTETVGQGMTPYPCPSHVDPGFLTMIMESSEGLEVKRRDDGRWHRLHLASDEVALVVGSAWRRARVAYRLAQHGPGNHRSSQQEEKGVASGDQDLFPPCYHRVVHRPVGRDCPLAAAGADSGAAAVGMDAANWASLHTCRLDTCGVPADRCSFTFELRSGAAVQHELMRAEAFQLTSKMDGGSVGDRDCCALGSTYDHIMRWGTAIFTLLVLWVHAYAAPQQWFWFLIMCLSMSMNAVYPLAAAALHGGDWTAAGHLTLEASVSLVLCVTSVAGFLFWRWLLVFAIAGHAVWDTAKHYGQGVAFFPWYTCLCMVFDMGWAAALASVLISQQQQQQGELMRELF